MATSDIVIPNDLQQLLTERQRIQEDQTQASSQMARIEQLATQVRAPAGLQPEPVQLLTIDNLPPAEIGAALGHLEAEVRTIGAAQQGIDQDHAEIADILRRAKNRTTMLIAAAIIAAIVVIALVFMVIR